jgi:hypothetical protein
LLIAILKVTHEKNGKLTIQKPFDINLPYQVVEDFFLITNIRKKYPSIFSPCIFPFWSNNLKLE